MKPMILIFNNSLPKHYLAAAVFFVVSQFVFSAYAGDDPEPVLVLTPPGELFNIALNGFRGELEEEFSVTVFEKSKDDNIKDVDRYFTSHTPKAIVIVGNRLLMVYLKYIRKKNKKLADIPVISIFALGTQKFINEFNNAVGISSQAPMLTAIVRFRAVVNKPMEKVGVIHRKVFEENVLKYIRLCDREKIHVKHVMVGDKKNRLKKEIFKALKQLILKDKVEALWIPNDNVILRSDLLVDVWLPICKKYKIPVITGVEVLVKPEIDFGTFAVIPDPKGTGIQAANLIFDLMEKEWKIEEKTVYPTISVYSVLNFKKAKDISKNVDRGKADKIVGDTKK